MEAVSQWRGCEGVPLGMEPRKLQDPRWGRVLLESKEPPERAPSGWLGGRHLPRVRYPGDGQLDAVIRYWCLGPEAGVAAGAGGGGAPEGSGSE